jgi:uncharacterized protein
MESSTRVEPPEIPVLGGRRGGRLKRRLAAVSQRDRGLVMPLALSWALAIFLLTELVRAGGFWQVAANTRILNVFIRMGVVRLTDTNIGLIGTAPDVRFYVQSRDYVDWIVVIAAIAALMVVWWVKAVQFHQLARLCGIEGRIGQHARAYFYGHGINRLFPFRMGNVASASALEGQGASLDRAAQVVYLGTLFIFFEAIGFAVYGAIALGYTQWLAELALPVGILALSYLIARAVRGSADGPATLRQHARTAYEAIRALDVDRVALVRLLILSVVAFAGLGLAFYLLTQAFSTTYVILNARFPVIAMAIVGGYLARLVPITPGGLGQWEWGCALALHTGGMSISDSVSATLLLTGVRYLTGGAIWGLIILTKGFDTNLGRVFELCRGGAVALRPSPGAAPKPTTETRPRLRLPTVSLPRPLPMGLLWPRLLGLVAIGMALFGLDRIARLLMQFWLLKSLGFSSVFWTNFRMGAILFVATAALYTAAIAAPAFAHRLNALQRRRALQIGALFGLAAGYLETRNYMQYLLLFHGKHWGKSDPVFHHDVSLYVFKLPAINHTLTVLWEMALLAVVSSMLCAWVAGRGTEPPPVAGRPARIAARLATPWTLSMVALLGVLMAIADYLRRYHLLLKNNENHSIYNGAQFVDVNGIWSTVHSITIEAVILLVGTAVVIRRLRRLRRNVYAPGTAPDLRRLRMRWVLVALIPGLLLDFGFKAMVGLRVQTQVTPNEPVVQLPFIKRHIDWTNDGFDLNKISTSVWSPKNGKDPKPKLSQLLKHPAIANAPIWPGFVSWQERLLDPQHADRPFLQGTPAEGHVDSMVYGPTYSTYHQQQKLRPYYDFLDMDMTRYWVRDGKGPAKERIFASSARELPQFTRDEWSRTWAQRNAIYTHGYGLVANAAQRKTANGEPVYASSGIPTSAKYPQLAVKHPEIYYGEGEQRMAFTDLRNLSEIGHPTAEGLVRGKYPTNVPSGVSLDSPLKRLVFGYRSGQFFNVLASKMIGSKSRVLYARQPIDRTLQVAPFLYDDTRPFAVANGNSITWMVNGMTTSNRFPYSQVGEIGDKSDRRTPFVRPTKRINYIRDSVKTTVDAYTGKTHFYKWADEPVVNTWASIYPHLFEPKSAMPAALKRQVQYPTQLAHLQMDDIWIFTHIKDPLTYFAQEDLYDDADQVFGPMITEGKKATFSIEPYYWMAKPGEKGLPGAPSSQQFAMSMIFTPENANNVHAIGTVYMDGSGYGRMSYAVIPKGSYFMSPQQADAAIDQDPFVAQQLGFWNRRGVRLIRGQMMPLIAHGELIYVEPLFIKSEQNPLPRLKRVLVVFRGHAVMAQDLPTALYYELHPNPQFPIRPGPELGGEPPFRIVPCHSSRATGCVNGKKVDQFNSSFSHDNRATNAHP